MWGAKNRSTEMFIKTKKLKYIYPKVITFNFFKLPPQMADCLFRKSAATKWERTEAYGAFARVALNSQPLRTRFSEAAPPKSAEENDSSLDTNDLFELPVQGALHFIVEE